MEKEYKNRIHPVLRGLKFFGFIILGAVAAAGFAFIFGYFVMLLWNWLMPEIFGLVSINFWQAAGIVLLARLIFGGFKHGSDHQKSNSPRKTFFSHWHHDKKSERICGDWRYFDDYWQKEGEQAYNGYIERKKEQEQK